jgi:hypothetical protein
MNKPLINRIIIGIGAVAGVALIVWFGWARLPRNQAAPAADGETTGSPDTAVQPPPNRPSEPPIIPASEDNPAPPSVTPTPVPPPVKPQVSKNFIIEIDDYTAKPDSITVDQGAKVTLVVRAKTTNVYYGGIELRSPVVSTGTIPAGSSATVSFTADQTFTFTPYWPASGVKKDYTFTVNVKKAL